MLAASVDQARSGTAHGHFGQYVAKSLMTTISSECHGVGQSRGAHKQGLDGAAIPDGNSTMEKSTVGGKFVSAALIVTSSE